MPVSENQPKVYGDVGADQVIDLAEDHPPIPFTLMGYATKDIIEGGKVVHKKGASVPFTFHARGSAAMGSMMQVAHGLVTTGGVAGEVVMGITADILDSDEERSRFFATLNRRDVKFTMGVLGTIVRDVSSAWADAPFKLQSGSRSTRRASARSRTSAPRSSARASASR